MPDQRATMVRGDLFQECCDHIFFNNTNPLAITSNDNQVVDIVESIELQYAFNGPFYSAQIVPDNQYNTMNQTKKKLKNTSRGIKSHKHETE